MFSFYSGRLRIKIGRHLWRPRNKEIEIFDQKINIFSLLLFLFSCLVIKTLETKTDQEWIRNTSY
jgi:hypothetical protein